jgi:chemotaxis protein CheX
MAELDILNLKGFISTAAVDIFDTMLSMELESVDAEASSVVTGTRIVGSVSFAGDVMGSIHVHVSKDFARTITAAMLGMEMDEVEDDEDILDVIGELSNMICGDLKSRLCDQGLPCELSIPSTTSGSDFRIESVGWARFERFAFRCQDQLAVVEVSMKPGN